MSLNTGKPTPHHLPTATISSAVADIPLELGYVDAAVTAPATWTLPPLQAPEGSIVLGASLTVRNTTAFLVTLVCSGSDTIDGSATLPVPAGTSTVLVADGALWKVFANDVLEQQSQTITVNPTLPIGGSNYHSVQAAIDSIGGGAVKPTTITISAGVYDENIRTDAVCAGGNYSLALVGDTRAIAGVQYVNGDLNIEFDGFLFPVIVAGAIVGYNPPLGTRAGHVTLTQTASPGNDVSVVIVGPAPLDLDSGGLAGIIQQPAFDSSLVGPVVAGDKVILQTSTGVKTERTVLTAIGNKITFDGAPISLNTTGSSVTFSPNVILQPTTAPAYVPLAPGDITGMPAFLLSGPASLAKQGIRFSVLVNNTSGCGLLVTNGICITSLNCLCDDLYGVLSSDAFISAPCFVNYKSNIRVNSVLTCIGGPSSLQIEGAAQVWLGDIYASGASNYGIQIRTQGQFMPNSAHVSNTLSTTGYAFIQDTNSRMCAYRSISGINCFNGMRFQDSSPCVSQIADYIFIGTGGGVTALCSRDGSIGIGTSTFYSGAVITNFATGFRLVNKSALYATNAITFTSVTNKYAVDATSNYLTQNSSGTDPTPSYVYTNVASGALPSAFPTQLVTGGPRVLTLDPAQVVSGTFIYRGKSFTLAAGDALAHTLVLPGAFFMGAVPTTVATFGAVGAFITFKVLSNTQVLVEGSSGVVFA